MRRALPWILAAWFLFSAAVLGYVDLREHGQITQDAADRREADRKTGEAIAQLKNDLAATKAEDAKKIAHLTKQAAGANGGGGSEAKHSFVRLGDILKEHPEYNALLERQFRRNLTRMYGSTLGTLNLPPAQLSKLKDLLVERQMTQIDAQEAAEDAGLQPGTPEWRQAMSQAAQDADQQIASILGPNADNTLLQLRALNSIQNSVQNYYAPDFAEAGMPLSPQQTAGLVQAMADANYAGKDTSTRPANYNQMDPSTDLTPHDQRILGEAATALTPAQLSLLQSEQMEAAQRNAIIQQYRSQGVTIRP